MKTCDHYDEHGRLAVERGEPVDHCDTCREFAEAERGVQALLRETAPDAGSDRDWQRDVLAATLPAQRQPRRRWLVASAAAVAAAAALVLALRSPGPGPGLRVAIDPGGARASPGDELPALGDVAPRGAAVEVRAGLPGGESYAGLWIYLDQRLLERCESACRTEGDELVYRFAAELGTYDILFVRSDAAPSKVSGHLGRDYESIVDGGGVVERRRIEVR